MILVPPGSDYALIDAGNGRKLEQFGAIKVNRPEISASFKPELSSTKWDQSDAKFLQTTSKAGKWNPPHSIPSSWIIDLNRIEVSFRMECFTSTFKHVGIFPEQIANWEWLITTMNEMKGFVSEPLKILNLFAYTGGASLTCALSGAEVTHVDSAQSTVNRAKKNATLNEITSIRWIVDDALTFLERERKRGNRYHGIIMDPPAYGIGAKKRRWQLEDQLQPLIETAKSILSEEVYFLLLNTYSPKVSTTFISKTIHRYFNNPSFVLVDDIGVLSTTDQPLILGNVARVISPKLPLTLLN